MSKNNSTNVVTKPKDSQPLNPIVLTMNLLELTAYIIKRLTMVSVLGENLLDSGASSDIVTDFLKPVLDLDKDIQSVAAMTISETTAVDNEMYIKYCRVLRVTRQRRAGKGTNRDLGKACKRSKVVSAYEVRGKKGTCSEKHTPLQQKLRESGCAKLTRI